MFTRDFSKVRLVVASILVVAATYAGNSIALNAIASWAERENDTYPFQGGDDPIRYVLPTLFGRPGKGRILLTGPSAAGNAFVPLEFDRAFKDYKVLHASFPMATLDDILVSMDYVEKVYGVQALPEIFVLGVTLRMVANVPRRFDPKGQAGGYIFWLEAINRYSPHYRIRSSTTGTYLEPKSLSDRVIAWTRFTLTKQQARYRAGVVSGFERLLNGVGFKARVDSALPQMSDVRAPLAKGDLPATVNYIRKVGLLPALRLWLTICKAPYTLHQHTPHSEDQIRARLEGRRPIYEWDPRQESDMVRRDLRELVARCDRRGIRLYVINLPEHPLNRELYNKGHYESFRTLVKEALTDTPFLDLRDEYGSEFFVDQEHVTRRGANRVSRRVVEFIKTDLNQPAIRGTS